MKSKRLTLVALITLFLASRLIHLMKFPSFLDEIIYLGWLDNIKQTHNWLLPLQEFGWEPLSIWFSTIINFFVNNNSLLSLRLTAVFFGCLSTITVYYIFKLFYSDRYSFFASCLYFFSPIIFLHDRLGLRGDSLVNFFFLLALLGILKRKKLLIALAIALGLMTKTTSVIIILIAALTFNWLPILAAAVPLAFFWLTNTLGLVINKQTVFVNSAGWWVQAKANLIQSIPWLIQYLTWPVILLVGLGLYFSWRRHRQASQALTISLFVSYLFMLLTAKIFFPRYLLITYQSTLLLAGFGLIELIKLLPNKLKWLGAAFFIPSLIFSNQIATDFIHAPWPEIERWQYITGWPSGYGLSELTQYLQSDSPDVLITENNHLVRGGLPHYWPDYSFQLIVMSEDNLTDFQPQPDQTVYLALNVLENPPDQFSAELIQSFPRPDNQSSLRLYKIQTE